MTKKIKILIADETLIAREGWKKILEAVDFVEVVGEAMTAHEIIKKIRELNPDILLMHLIWFGDESAGWRAIREIKRDYSYVRVIAMTTHENLINDARLAGADAILSKTITRGKLLTIIRELAPREINI